MNDGVISLVLYIIFGFIFIGGWLSQEIAEARWKEDVILLILLLLLLSPLVDFSFFDFEFSILLFVLPILSGFILIRQSEKVKFFSLLGGILIATLYNMLVGLLALDPILLILEERLLIGLILGLLLGLLHVPLQLKLVTATLGIWLGLLYFLFDHKSQIKKLQLFSYYELDLLFTLYLCTVWMHFVSNLIYSFIKKKPIFQHEDKKV